MIIKRYNAKLQVTLPTTPCKCPSITVVSFAPLTFQKMSI